MVVVSRTVFRRYSGVDRHRYGFSDTPLRHCEFGVSCVVIAFSSCFVLFTVRGLHYYHAAARFLLSIYFPLPGLALCLLSLASFPLLLVALL